MKMVEFLPLKVNPFTLMNVNIIVDLWCKSYIIDPLLFHL